MKAKFSWNSPAGGGVPGHAGEQWPGGLRSGGAEGDGPVLLRADGQTAARQVELGPRQSLLSKSLRHRLH